MKVPEAQRRVGLETPVVPTRRSPTLMPEAFGAGTAKAIGVIADEASNFASAISSHIEERNKQKALAQASQESVNAEVEQQDFLTNEKTGLLNRKMSSAEGITKEYDNYWNKTRNERLAKISDPNGQADLSNKLNSLYVSGRNKVIQHEATQRQAALVDAHTSFIGMKIQSASGISNPDEMRDTITKISEEQDKLDSVTGASKETGALDKRKAIKAAIDANIDGLIATDPTGIKATTMLKSLSGYVPQGLEAELNDSIATKAKKKLEQIQDAKKTTQLTNDSQLLKRVASGEKISTDEISQMQLNGEISEKLATPLIAIFDNPTALEDFKSDVDLMEDDDRAFVESTRRVLSAPNQEKAVEYLADALSKISGSEKGFNRVKLLASVALEKGLEPTFTKTLESVIMTAETTGLNASFMTDIILQGIKAGVSPEEAKETAFALETERQNGSNEKEEILNDRVGKKRDNLMVMKSDDENTVFSYLVKSGTPIPDAGQKSSDIVKKASAGKDELEYKSILAEEIDKAVPTLRIGNTRFAQWYRKSIAGKTFNERLKNIGVLTPIQEVGKAALRAPQLIPPAFESVYQFGVDILRNETAKKLAKKGAIFGISDAEFNSRSEKDKKEIASLNETYEMLNRADNVSKELRQTWITNAFTGIEAPDPILFQGTFMENPSWVRAVSGAVESSGLLGVSLAISSVAGPGVGAGILSVVQASEEYNKMRESGLTTDDATPYFLANAVANYVLEVYSLKGFLEGGSFGKRIVSGVFKEGVVEEGGQQVSANAIWNTAVSKLGEDKARDLFDGVVESVVYGGISGGLLGAAIPGKAAQIDGLVTEAKENGVNVDGMIDAIGQYVTSKDDLLFEKVVGDIEKMTEVKNAKGNGEGVEEGSVKAQGVEQGTESGVRVRSNAEAGMEAKEGKGIEKLSSESGQVSISLPTKEQKQDAYQRIFNRFQSIEDTVTRAKELGAVIEPGEDAGASADRYLSVANQAGRTLEHGTFRLSTDGRWERTGEGLRNIIVDYESKVNTPEALDDLQTYLTAQRTINDLQRPKFKGASENIVSDEQVAQATQDLETINAKYADKKDVFTDIANRIYDFQKRVLHMLVDNRSISQEQYDDIVSKNPHYIPFDRVMGEEQALIVPQKKRGFEKAKAPIKKIKGSERAIENVFESIIKNTYKIMNAAGRNKVFVDIYSLKDIEGLDIREVPPDRIPITVTEEEAGEEITIFRPSAFKPKGNVVEGYVDGKRKFLELDDNLFAAMTAMNEQSSTGVIKFLAKFSRTLRRFVTITGEFMVRNVMRDQHVAWLQSETGFIPYVDSFKAIADILGNKEIVDEFMQSGGAYGGFVELSRPALHAKLQEFIRKPSIMQRLNVVDSLERLSGLLEQSTRLATFKSAKAQGATSIEAARTARESTVNFQRGGTDTRVWSSITAFFGSSLQSFDKTIRTFQANPGRLTLRAVASITMPSVFLYLRNRKEPDYYELPRWQRDLFWVFKVNGQWYSIPKPFSYGQIFGSSVERFLEFSDTKNRKAMDELLPSLLGSLNPAFEDPMAAILPTAVKPLIENVTDWSFFYKRPIVPKSKENLIPSQQFTKYTSESAKKLGIIFNYAPAKIENLIKGWFGGTGRYVLDTADIMLDFEKDKGRRPYEVSDMPVLRALVARNPVGMVSQSVSDFYESRSDINMKHATYNKFIKDGDREKAKALVGKYPELKLYSELEDTAKKISTINEKIDKITEDKQTSVEEKRSRLKKYDDMITEEAQRANALIRKRKM